MTKYMKFRSYLIEKLRDPKEAKAFLSGAIFEYEENGDNEAFMLALRYLAEAQGGVGALSERAHLDRKNLYKVLTGKTAPRLNTTFSIIKGLGYHLSPETTAN